MIARFCQALDATLVALTAAESATVRMGGHPPSDPVPLVSWEVDDYDPIMRLDDSSGDQGMEPVAYIDVTIEVYDTDPVRRGRLMDAIVGTHYTPGLIGTRKWLPTPASDVRVGVEACMKNGDFETDFERPEDGTEQGWFTGTVPLKFHVTSEG